MTMRSVGVMQELTRTEKREAHAERFEREAEKSAAEKRTRRKEPIAPDAAACPTSSRLVPHWPPSMIVPASSVAKHAPAKIALARWLGDGAEAPLAGRPAIDAIRLDPITLDSDLNHHPEIAVLARKEDVAAAEVRVAQANKKAD
jgi:hypothetical protein